MKLPSFVSKLAAIAALLLGAGPTTGFAANLLINGSFETGPSFGGNFINVNGGSTAITGWTVGGLAVDYSGPGTWNISDGIRNIDLDGSVGSPYPYGSISQTFATTIGQSYFMTFDLSGNPAGGPLVKQVQVSAGANSQIFGHNIGAIVSPNLPLSITYQQQQFTFTAIANTSTLTFTSLTPQSGITGYGAVIDNVFVGVSSSSSVPDAGSTAALLALGLGVLGFARRMLGELTA
jgi:choice-of-anchor C domain-containing protein